MTNFSTLGELQLVVAKSKKGNLYRALCINLGYTRKFLVFDASTIAEIVGESVQTIMGLEEGVYEIVYYE